MPVENNIERTSHIDDREKVVCGVYADFYQLNKHHILMTRKGEGRKTTII